MTAATVEAGAAAVLLCPGIDTTEAVFAPLGPALRTIGPTRPAAYGDGETVEAMADALLADAPAQFHLVGFSFGGYVALAALAKAPARIAGLTLISTMARPDDAGRRAMRRLQIAKALAGEHAQGVRARIPLLIAPQRAGEAALARAIEADALAAGAAAFVQRSRAALARADLTPPPGLCRGPRLVISGGLDRLTPPDAGRTLAAALEAEFVVLADCGHMAPLEAAEACAAAIVAHHRGWAERG